jgi:short-subunit dehydrogenase
MQTILKDKWALVTGASSGFGTDFAKELGSMGCNLVLTARRKERLEQVADEISQLSEVSVSVLPFDLSILDAPQQLYEQIKSKGIQVDVLINNAGFGLHG